MVDRQKEFLTYRLCEKPTLKCFERHMKPKPDGLLDSAFIIVRNGVLKCINECFEVNVLIGKGMFYLEDKINCL
jgi:hypothetical protein